jgi:G3E family GTPase
MTENFPFTVIGGYLGAGKTTLLNHLLADARGLRVAVLVNDFGSVNIDVDLIRSHDGDTINLANGCMC